MTWWPMAASTVAMALMPAPPAPTTCTRGGPPRGRGPRLPAPPPPSGQAGAGQPAWAAQRAWASTTSATRAAASGRPSAPGRRAHGGQAGRGRPAARRAPRRGGRRRSRRRARAPPAPAATSARALAVWWSPGSAGQRHQHRRDPGHRQLGHGDGPGPADHEVGRLVEERPSGSRTPQPVAETRTVGLVGLVRSPGRRHLVETTAPGDVVERPVAAVGPAARPATPRPG